MFECQHFILLSKFFRAIVSFRRVFKFVVYLSLRREKLLLILVYVNNGLFFMYMASKNVVPFSVAAVEEP